MVVRICNRPMGRLPVSSSQVAAVLLRCLYVSPGLLFLLTRMERKEIFTNDFVKLSVRSVKQLVPEETERKQRRGVTLRTMSGEEILVETLVASSTYREFHALARTALNLQLRASPISMRLQYLSSYGSAPRHPHFQLHDVVPCHDLYCQKTLRGTVWQVVLYSCI
jgi:hypothetical protein